MRELWELIRTIAPSEATVLVAGESGTGKELAARAVHEQSRRAAGPFVAVNCGALTETLLASELFGHEKGAFTGALDARKGYFEEADGGTIFLDEVAELPLPTQARLLRVLQSGEFIRVGSSKVQKTNVRVVAATNTDLPQAILSGRFREDLYYRLGTVPIVVPALRERPGDIPLLFRKFASDVATQYRMPAVTLDNGAREVLMDYYWRGNIRQLKNVAEQISAIEQVRVVSPEVLAKYLPRQEGGAPVATDIPRMGADMATERELLYKVLFDMRSDINDLKRMLSELMQGAWVHREPSHDIKALLPSATQGSVRVMESGSAYGDGVAVDTESEDVTDEPPREKTKADMQREQIVRALRHNNGRRREAAAELFMSERTLYRKIKELGIEENS
ncbi:MAG: sigma-54 dependent transcriptional regulator [Alistipes sp.]|nr:sigma-54 dependent transcriptional regulator [Alistipes sp.]